MKIKKGLYIIMGILATGAGLYPLTFLLIGSPFELLNSKGKELLESLFWNYSFYAHIIFGGIALSVGWILFSRKFRPSYMKYHRNMGKVYVLSAALSALGGIFISLFTEGGLVTSVGFISLGIIWLYSTLRAYTLIRNKAISEHEKLMTYSYAACFAAVTLRVWEPILSHLLNDGELAYKVVAWWCWIPNLLIAHFIVNKELPNKYLERRQY